MARTKNPRMRRKGTIHAKWHRRWETEGTRKTDPVRPAKRAAVAAEQPAPESVTPPAPEPAAAPETPASQA